MKSFQEFITELFNSSFEVPEPSVSRSGLQITYSFKTDNEQNVKVNFYNISSGIYDTDFSVNGQFKLTKTGEAIQIFSAVIEITKAFVNEYKPQEIRFSSDKNEKSRVNLYRKFLTKFANKHNFNFDEKESKTFGPQVNFILTF